MSYFVINKQLDFERGYFENTVADDGVLYMSDDSLKDAHYITRIFDCTKEATQWHRLSVKTGLPNGQGIVFYVYATDKMSMIIDDQKWQISDFLMSNFTLEKKMKELEPYLSAVFSDGTEFWLHNVYGRYLFVIAELQFRDIPNSIEEMSFSFSMDSWIKHLPMIYSKKSENSDFFERFLGIYQSFYEDREEKIAKSASLINPKAVDRQLLEKLADWYDIQDVYLWSDENLAKLVSEAPKLLKVLGTRKGIIKYVSLYTGEDVELIDDPNNKQHFHLKVSKKFVQDKKEYQALLKIVDQAKPANVKISIMPIEQPMIIGPELVL